MAMTRDNSPALFDPEAFVFKGDTCIMFSTDEGALNLDIRTPGQSVSISLPSAPMLEVADCLRQLSEAIADVAKEKPETNDAPPPHNPGIGMAPLTLIMLAEEELEALDILFRLKSLPAYERSFIENLKAREHSYGRVNVTLKQRRWLHCIYERVRTDGHAEIDQIGLPSRVVRYLKGAGIHTVEELTFRTKRDLLRIEIFGAKALDHVNKALAARGLRLAG